MCSASVARSARQSMVNCPVKRKMAETPNTSPFDVLKSPPDEAALVSGLRAVKNQIIGNKHKKAEYRECGLIPLIIDQAHKYPTNAVFLQVSATLYSMAAGGGAEAAAAIEEAGGPQLLCRMLAVPCNDEVVLGAARALKFLYDVRALHYSQPKLRISCRFSTSSFGRPRAYLHGSLVTPQGPANSVDRCPTRDCFAASQDVRGAACESISVRYAVAACSTPAPSPGALCHTGAAHLYRLVATCAGL